jgi:GT2 family glycosyltransferase
VRISVIIVNYNLGSELPHVLSSLARQRRPPDEVILVDNASTDGSVDLVRELFPWVRIIPSPTNVGFSEGNNIGLAHARGEYVALLNSDAVAEEQWLEELAAVLDTNETVAASVPKIYRAGSERIIEQAGAEFNNLGHCWTRGFDQVDHGQLETQVEVPILTGCSALVRRAALHGEPLFDPAFFMYYEELELSLRLRGRGYSLVYVPSAVVHHQGRRSIRNVTPEPELFVQYLCNRNRLKILAKYYPLSLLMQNLPLILMSVMYWDLVFARRRGLHYAAQAIRAQIGYALAGLVERRRTRDVDPAGWLPWMTHQGIHEMLSVRRSLANIESLEASGTHR